MKKWFSDFFKSDIQTISLNSYFRKKAIQFSIGMLIIVNALGYIFVKVKIDTLNSFETDRLTQKAETIKKRLHGELEINSEHDVEKLMPDIRENYLVDEILLSKSKPRCRGYKNIKEVKVCAVLPLENQNAESDWFMVVSTVPLELNFDTWFLIILSFVFIVFVVTGIFALKKGLTKQISIPAREIELDPENWSLEKYREENFIRIKEIERLGLGFKESLKEARDSASKLEKLKKQEELYNFTRVLAHDIRSPLGALEALHHDFKNVDERQRLILRGAIRRIRGIAERIVQDQKEESSSGNNQVKSIMLAPLVNEVVSERCEHLKARNNLRIEEEFKLDENSHFVIGNNHDLKRVLSNIINNSVEAQDSGEPCTILIKVKNSHKDSIDIVVEDNGPGFPEDKIKNIFERGYSAENKKSSGLGLHSAKAIITQWGGTISAQNIYLGNYITGFRVTLTLDQGKAPSWYVSTLQIKSDTIPVVLDDDTLIHSQWDNVFSSLEVEPVHFEKGNLFMEWFKGLSSEKRKRIVFLSDYELIGEDLNGIDIIRALKLEKQSILVSGRFDELEENSEKIEGIKLVAKSSVHLLKIILEKNIIDQQPSKETNI